MDGVVFVFVLSSLSSTVGDWVEVTNLIKIYVNCFTVSWLRDLCEGAKPGCLFAEDFSGDGVLHLPETHDPRTA